MTQKLFTRDFTMVVLGQIVSLFGNAALRFALPLYLLNLTGSAALYGTVTACALIPAVLLSPVGGIVADRVNKRDIMVTLDFLTSALVLAFVQSETPQELTGKVISVILTVCMCAQPLGSALYGALFELCAGAEWAVVLFSAIASLLIALMAGRFYRRLALKS